MATTKPSTYWRDLCAPILKRRKEALGRKVPEREIAAFVESESGKDTGRALINLFLLGEREPYVSQFIALCTKLELSPLDVLAGRLVVSTIGAPTHSQERKVVNAGILDSVQHSKSRKVKSARRKVGKSRND